MSSESAFCTTCGARLPEHAPACASAMPTPPSSGAEQTLIAFGPLGYEHCSGRPGLFVWMQKNNTQFFVTTRRLCLVQRGQVKLEIPLPSIHATQVFPFMLGQVLWVQYWDGSAWKELSILGSALCHGPIHEAHRLLQERLQR